MKKVIVYITPEGKIFETTPAQETGGLPQGIKFFYHWVL